jgi:serine protease Do
MPSVVQVLVTGYDLNQELLALASNPLGTVQSTGTGVILHSDGYIVTNAHLVAAAIRVQVELPAALPGAAGARSILRARGRLVGAQVVAVDEETDLAVLKIAEKGLPALPLGDSDDLRPGQIVLAFGSPLGLQNSVTMGVVSAVARQLEPEDPMIYIQTDASINPGNSGGPLVDTEGRCVGINTFIFSQSGGNEGLGFAAPSNIVRNVFEQIRTTGRVRRGDIGVFAQTITPTLAQGLGLSREWGVVLGDVFPDGPAAAAGLRIGDLVLALEGKPMENGRQFHVNLYGRAVGQSVMLEIERGGTARSLRVAIVEREDDPGRLAALAPSENLVARLGILALDLTPEVASLLPDLRVNNGVVVAAVSAHAPASREGTFKPGDVIHAVNRTTVSSLPELRAVIERTGPDQPVVVQAEREGVMMFLAFRP